MRWVSADVLAMRWVSVGGAMRWVSVGVLAMRWVSVGVLLWCVGAVGQEAASRPRLFYSIAAYDRKQHVHLKRLVAEAASACEGGLRVTLRVYSCDGTSGSVAFSAAEVAELEQLAFCTRGDLRLVHEVRPGALRHALTMEHRDAFREELEAPSPGASPDDVFAYGEDDVLLSLRSLVAFAAESRRLRAAADGTRYVVGFQRFETTGTGLAATEVLWENARPHWWAPVDIGGDLYLLPTNVHAGAYALTRADFEAVAAECPAYVVEKREKRVKREMAAGWRLYLHCGRRKAIPARRFHAFLVHHLTDRNWWERSACAAPLQTLAATFADWVARFDAGDRSFLCGNWWDMANYRCDRRYVRHLRRDEIARQFGGARHECGVVHNVSSDTYTAHRPWERTLRAIAIARACDYQAREAARATTGDLLRRFGDNAAGVAFFDEVTKKNGNFGDLVLEAGAPVLAVRPDDSDPPP